MFHLQSWTQYVKEALIDKYWINAMQEEVVQFERNKVWELVSRPDSVNIIGTKWIYKKKLDENGNVTRNKACLVDQGYTQIEGIDFHDTFIPFSHLESIILLIGLLRLLKFKLYQMGVKSSFLNGVLTKEVHV